MFAFRNISKIILDMSNLIINKIETILFEYKYFIFITLIVYFIIAYFRSRLQKLGKSQEFN